MNILIVEDEILIAELFKAYIQEFGHNVTGIAISYEEAITMFNLQKPDLILLDIRLYGDKSGIDFANFLNDKKESIPLIFLTSQYDQRTLNLAIEANPYGYLTKPVRKETLWTSIEAAYKLFNSRKPEKPTLELFDGKSIHYIAIKDILFIKADHVYINVNLIDGQVLFSRKSLKQIINELDYNSFVQCHRSYLVNRIHIKQRNLKNIVLSNDQIIPISKGNKNVFTESK